QGTDECLNIASLNGVALGISFRLHVYSAEPQHILVDDAINPAIVAQLRHGAATSGPAVSHRQKQVNHRGLKKPGVLAAKAVEKFRGNTLVNTGNSGSDLFVGGEWCWLDNF